MFAALPRRALLSKWTVPSGRSKAVDPHRAVQWGRISARGSGSVYDQGVAAHIEGKERSVNRAAPRGLLRGFANEEQPPALPSSSKKTK